MNILYVYAITRGSLLPECEGVDGTRRFGTVGVDGISAAYTPVAESEFSQETIDARAKDLQWLGAIGYQHQQVVSDLMRLGTVIPLRAFTLFSTPEALLAYIQQNRTILEKTLDRLDGKREWTLRIEFQPQRWSESLSARVPALASIEKEIAEAGPGKAFLLSKKRDEERRRASHEAEKQVVTEIEQAVIEALSCETVAESRQSREGAFPQINVLLDRDEETRLEELQTSLAARYGNEGVTLAVSGPWPPYTFAATTARP